MPLPELVKRSAENALKKYCDDKVPRCFQGEVRLSYRFEGNEVTLLEERAACPRSGCWIARQVAQFRYNDQLRQWSLHFFDSERRWCFYTNFGPTLDFSSLLRHVDEDPLNRFWE